jgi:hypothetical protein
LPFIFRFFLSYFLQYVNNEFVVMWFQYRNSTTHSNGVLSNGVNERP